MTRRVSLPGVDELFRSSGARTAEIDLEQEINLQVVKGTDPQPESAMAPAMVEPAAQHLPASETSETDGARRPRHDEKVTFYCTASDLTRIERARLALRAEHKLASDRGRIVRAAIAEILDDFDANGSESVLVRRLRAV